MMEKILSDLGAKGFSYNPGFLDSKALKEMTGFFEEHKNSFAAARVGKDRTRDESIRGDYTFWLDPLDPPEAFKSTRDFLEGLKSEVNQKFFLGLKQFEFHLALYPQGAFYRKHSDQFENSSSRALTFIFYLNESWSPADGGELIFYDKNDEVLATICPSPGTFVTFFSADFPHEVLASKKDRKSLTGWIHNRIIY